MKVLITGGMGKTAEPLIALLLKNGYDITILDISSDHPPLMDQQIKILRKDIGNFDDISDAFDGIDVTIHLAVNISHTDDAALSFQTNVYGTYNVLSQALKHGVSKVLLASSAPVHTLTKPAELKQFGHQTDYVCSTDSDFTYDLTKNIQEVIARNFSLTYAMNIMVLRLGHIVDGTKQTDLHGNPLSEVIYCRGGWVCRYDVARAFMQAIKTDFNGFHLLNIVGSYQISDYIDLSTAKDIIDFECAEKFLLYSAE